MLTQKAVRPAEQAHREPSPAGTREDPPAGGPSFGPGATPRDHGEPADTPAMVDLETMERAGMARPSRARSRIAEEFTLVQRHVLRSAFGPNAQAGWSNLLLVTSARPGEGKSFVSLNLAASVARHGQHPVLLVDADLKRDSLSAKLDVARRRGLLDLAADPRLDPDQLLVPSAMGLLSVLPAGRARERGAEPFALRPMTLLVQRLGRRYDQHLVILDVSPCLCTSDPAVLSQVVGQALLVVEADRTRRNEIEAALDLIQACPAISLLLNKQQARSRHTFGVYDSYYAA